MAYTEIKYIIPADRLPEIETWLSENLNLNYFIKDMVGADKDPELYIYYTDDDYAKGDTPLLQRLKQKLQSVENNELITRGLTEEVWAREWLNSLKPFEMLNRFKIIPYTRDNKPGNPGTPDNNIYISPGVVFGTGRHPTTRLAAGFLKDNIKEGTKFLDIGTGSAILSILAARFGASDITALENDPAALQKAGENLELNQVQCLLISSDLLQALETSESETYDVIASNVISKVQLRLRDPKLPLILKPGGKLILSGTENNPESENTLTETLLQNGYRIIKVEYLEGWLGVLAEKQ